MLFGLLVWQVQSGGALVRLDGTVNAGLAAIRNRATLLAGAWVSQAGTGAAGAVVCLIASGALWSDGRTVWLVSIWTAFVGAQITTWSLKFITRRRRPDGIDGISAASPSFPSAHATVSTAVYGTVALGFSEGFAAGRTVFLATAALLVLLIGFSRLLLSLHYLTDVLAGAVVGLFWILIGLTVVGV